MSDEENGTDQVGAPDAVVAAATAIINWCAANQARGVTTDIPMIAANGMEAIWRLSLDMISPTEEEVVAMQGGTLQ